jgi:hypothetical protein
VDRHGIAKNPKSEIRNPKQIQNDRNAQNGKTKGRGNLRGRPRKFLTEKFGDRKMGRKARIARIIGGSEGAMPLQWSGFH